MSCLISINVGRDSVVDWSTVGAGGRVKGIVVNYDCNEVIFNLVDIKIVY